MPASSAEAEKRFVRRMAAAFAECSIPAKQYGQCIKTHLDGVQKGACEKEFASLNRCFRAALCKRPA